MLKKQLFIISLLFGVISSAMAADPVKLYGQLQVNGNQLCSEQGEPVVLRGVSYGWHNLWPRFYNKKSVKWLKEDWKCTVLRAAMGTCIEDNYIENPEHALNCINAVVKAAIKNNVYVIIDWHTYYPQKEEAKAFFSMMAQKYGKYPHVIYEIYNEPMENTWESVKEYATDIITQIRKYDPDNIILVGSPHWDQDLHLVAADPLQGFNNIMYTLHFYAATHKQELRDRATAAWEQGIPIFVSECAGMECTGDGPLDIEEWTRWVEWMEAHKISWMNVIKVVLGFLELAFALKFLSVADLAYGWGILDRETFLALWIVIFALLGFYLLGKIKFPHDDDDDKVGVARFFMALISLAFAVYMVPGLWGAPLKAVSAFAPPMNTQDFNLYTNEVHAQFDDYDAGMEYAKRTGKPVMLDFTGYGCVNCRKMEAAVWTDPKVNKLMTEDYVLITLFVDNKTPLPEHIKVMENGKERTLRTIGDKWSYLQRSKFGANAQPFYVLIDNEGKPLNKSYSYDEDIDKYVDFLQTGLQNYKK